MDSSELARFIDHTLLKPEAALSQIERLCEEAIEYSFCSVCVNPFYIRDAARILHGSGVKTCTVVGFPLGANRTAVKLMETWLALEDGAQEIDMVLNVGALKTGNLALVRDDIRAVVGAAKAHGALTKVILETCLLTDAEKKAACAICVEAGAQYVKTSTGFSTGGAQVGDIALMSGAVRAQGLGVKASGGIKTLEDALAMIKAGATRVGCSAGVKIIGEAREKFGA